jgi:ABC-type lipoprotein release transport system permease subunit
MGHQGVQLLVAIDALLLALVGAIAGSAVGVAAAPLLVGALSSMSEHLQQLPVRAADPSPTTALIAVAFSVTVALLGGAPHALRARTSHPLDLIQVHRDSSRELPSQRYLALRAVVLASGALASWLALGMPAAIRLVGVLLLGLAAVALCGGPALRELARLLRPRLVRVRPMGALVGVSLPAGSYALAASLAVTSAVLAGATAVLCVIQSLLGTMDDDLEVRYGHGALVASLASGSRSSALVLPDSIDLIRRISGITDVAEYYDSTLFFQGQEFAIRALSTSALFRNGSLLEDETPIEDVRQALLRGEVVACTTFVHHFRVAVGHEIALDTHAGPRTFRVGGIVAGFGASTGSLLMDVHTFDRHFRRSGASFLQIWADRPLSQIFEEIARQTADIQPLFFSSGADLREVSRRLAGRFAGLLYSLVAVAGCFAGIGVLAIGTSAVMARREDLMLLQICGASPLTVGAVVLLDSFALVAAAAIPSVPLGLASASVAIDLFKEGYGWALRPHATVGPLTVVLAGVLGCAAVAGVVPAWASTRLLDRGRLSAP